MSRVSILIVDDDRITRETLSKALSDNYDTFTARNGQDAISTLKSGKIDVLLSDLIMPGMSGIGILEAINDPGNMPVVIFITGHATVESAVQAMKMGAYDYITKPVNLDRLHILIEKSLENKRLKEENILLRNKLIANYDKQTLVGSSFAIRKVADLVKQVSSTNATVLIDGESGTGKELVANIIHYNSPASGGPFIKVNCAAFAEGLLESELFGHEKGAFTGAVSMKKGRFELADGGTLFLDEVGDIPLSIQVKLLRFLQDKSFERVGATETLKVDVRIIAATNRNLEEMVKVGTFRDDLYYRLRIVKIVVPPLRDREDDTDELVKYYIERYSDIHNKKIVGITDDVMRLIESYRWPGNIRELMNCIESSVVLTNGDEITVESIPDYLYQKLDSESNDNGMLGQLEQETILKVLNQTGGNKAKAAKVLGIGLRTLYRKIKDYSIT